MLFVLAGIIIAILTIIFSWITITVPVVPLFGIIIMLLCVTMFFGAELFRWLTPQIITKRGHFPYRIHDIRPIPWTEMYVDNEEKVHTVRYGNMVLVEAGGIDFGGVSLRGRSNFPVVLAPAKHIEKIGKQICCRTNLTNSSIFEHNLSIQKNLEPLVRDGRIKIKKKKNLKICDTNILYGITSSIDKSDTSDNIQYECLVRENNKQVTFFKEMADDIREEYERAISSKNKGKEQPVAIIKSTNEESY